VAKVKNTASLLVKLDPVLERHRESVMDFERTRSFDQNSFTQLSELGIFSALELAKIEGPESERGHWLALSCFFEKLAARVLDLPFVSSLAAHGGVAMDLLDTFGNEKHKQTYLRPSATGTSIGCVANSESGSSLSLKKISSQVAWASSGGQLSGTKSCATNATIADWFLISALEPAKSSCLELFIISRQKGVQIKNFAPSLAGFWTGSTGSIAFSAVPLKETDRFGKTREASAVLRHCFDLERLLMASLVLGTLRALEQQAIAAVKSRGPEFQQAQFIQNKIFRIHRTRAILEGLMEVARKRSREPGDTSLAVAKDFLCNGVVEAAEAWVELEGGRALCTDHPAQKVLRDFQMLRFFGGTAELQKTVCVQNLISAAELSQKVKAA